MRNVLLSIAAAASLTTGYITGQALANESKITKGFKSYDSSVIDL